IKLIILVFLKDSTIYLVSDWLSITQHHNTGPSSFGSLIGFSSSHSVISVLPSFFINIILYLFFNRLHIKPWLTSRAISLSIAGNTCFAIDKLLFGYTNDYIHLQQFAYFDLKDIYLLLSTCIIIQIQIYIANKIIKMGEKRLFFVIRQEIIKIKNKLCKRCIVEKEEKN
ncbi:MAG: signal peptidase II, partial [Spirochaetaceae bacterium]|nr:signal peptidase II [Spirochaetaceae bacterium]